MKSITTTALLLAICALAQGDNNWPSWRGPHANGVADQSATPPTKWDEQTNIRWKIETPGKGSASPIIWGDQLFIVTAVKTNREAKSAELPKVDPRFQTKTQPPTNFYRFEVISYDRHTGKENWRKVAAEAVPHEGHHATHSYAAGSPTTDGKRLYVSFGSFGIFAFDLEGNALWQRKLGQLHTRLGWGEAVTPVIYEDSLILNWDQESDSKLIVLDAATGKTKWQVSRDEKTSWNTPTVVKHENTVQVLINGTNRARSYNLADGSILWEVGGMTTNAIPSPLVHDGTAYFFSGYRGAAAVAVPLSARGELTEASQFKWRYNKGTPYVPTPILYDGRIYFTATNQNVMTVLDAATGKVLVDSERLPKVGSFYASPIVAGRNLYFVSREGATAVLSATASPDVISINKLGDEFDASPAAVGKTLYLRGAKYLYAIEAK